MTLISSSWQNYWNKTISFHLVNCFSSQDDVLETPKNQNSRTRSPIMQRSTRKVTRQRVCISVESSLLDETVDKRVYPPMRQQQTSGSSLEFSASVTNPQQHVELDVSQGTLCAQCTMEAYWFKNRCRKGFKICPKAIFILTDSLLSVAFLKNVSIHNPIYSCNFYL